MGAVAVGALLFAVLLVVVAALVWQEARGAGGGSPEYLLDEAAEFVLDRLSGQAASRLDGDDVRDLLLWGIEEHKRLLEDGAAAVYGSGDVLEALVDRSQRERGEAYDPVDVAEVIAAEGEYLAAIGAVGDPAAGVDS
jgi:hypothetical protein